MGGESARTRVLVVEDEETVALTLSAILTDEGYEVDEAPSASSALRLIDASEFDVALLDLRLGPDDGLSVLRRLKQLAPRTVALVLTGYGSLETAIQAMRLGASDYLLKPCDVMELKAAIARGLEQRGLAEMRTAPDPEEVERVAAAARQARDDFLDLAGHHLKTPLASVLGWTQYAQRQLARGQTEEASAKLELAVQHSRRIARLVEVFADMVRVQQGLGLVLTPIDLRRVLELAVRAAQASDSQHHFGMGLPEDPAIAAVDFAAMSTVFSSLLDNAAKFSPSGSDVTIRLFAEGDHAVVAVRDLGAGLEPDEMQAVFERSAEPEPAVRHGAVPGLGMGLYLSRALVAAQGGRIWAKSAGHDQGSEFFVALPLVGSQTSEEIVAPSTNVSDRTT